MFVSFRTKWASSKDVQRRPRKSWGRRANENEKSTSLSAGLADWEKSEFGPILISVGFLKLYTF